MTDSAAAPAAAQQLIRQGRPRFALWVGVWAVVNVALGVVLAYPLIFLESIGRHARAMVFDRPDSPFSPKEIEGGEADGFIPFGIFLAVLILAVVTAINWPLVRRLRLPGWAAKAGIVAVTAALVVTPRIILI
ncbi:hypothetical protein GCM10009789_54440 [Kribbella sancticallisti]|uniref:Uncharacterized protein n=1 Tax=Kribbella sancticallisti TaxID=460087 RepID=A0ABP4Q0G1_9ACTN